MIYDNYLNKPPFESSESTGESITIPNQAPSLKYIIQALSRGETLNIKQALKFDNNPSLDEPSLPVDLHTLGSSDIESLLQTFTPPTPQENPAPDPVTP